MIQLGPTIPSAAIERRYARRMKKLLKEMENQILLNIEGMPPDVVDNILQGWEEKWETFGKETAKQFTDLTDLQSQKSLEAFFKKNGFTLDFKVTPDIQKTIDATIAEQVHLIKSIPRQYHDSIMGMIERSISNNWDIKQLRDDIISLGHSTERRAMMIAKDQTAKMTNSITTARCKSVGITQGIWMHRAGGSKTFRQSHVKLNGEIFDLDKGIYDPEVKRWIHCGELPACKCIFKPVIPELKEAGADVKK